MRVDFVVTGSLERASYGGSNQSLPGTSELAWFMEKGLSSEFRLASEWTSVTGFRFNVDHACLGISGVGVSRVHRVVPFLLHVGVHMHIYIHICIDIYIYI